MQSNSYKKYLKYENKINELKQSFNSIQHGGSPAKSIDNNVKYVIDEIHFWGNQICEHTLFMHLGIVADESLNKRGIELHEQLQKYLDKTFKGIDQYKIVLDDTDFAKLDLTNTQYIDEAYVLFDKVEKYKLDVLAKIKSGKWIGWLFASFIEHILEELQELKLRTIGPAPSIHKQVAYWNEMNGEHAGFASHLLDPELKNDKLVSKASTFEHELLGLHDSKLKQFIELSINKTKEFDKFSKETQKAVHDNKVSSIIHPMLIDHDVREGERSMYCLKILKTLAPQ